MNIWLAIQIIEDDGEYPYGEKPTSYETYCEAFQYLIDSGHLHHLQGWFGREAVHMIDAGDCVA